MTAPGADPLTDPLAEDLARIDIDELSHLVAMFRTATTEATDTAGGLTAAAGLSDWHGGAARAFHGAIGGIPRRLAAVADGFDQVGQALERYAAAVEPLRSSFMTLRARLEDAAGQVGRWHGAVERQRRHVDRLGITAAARPARLAAAQSDLTVYEGRLSAQQDDLAAMQAQARRILEEFGEMRSSARSSIAAMAPSPAGGSGATTVGPGAAGTAGPGGTGTTTIG